MRTSLRRIGNSQGVLIPKPLLAQAGLDGEIDLSIEDGALVLRAVRPAAPRSGWAAAARELAAAGDDGPVWPALANADDADLAW